MTALRYEVRNSRDFAGQRRPEPSRQGPRWCGAPISTTLIYGEHDAVLVDPPFTTDTTREVLAWVEKIGRDVMEVHVTHGHGDHRVPEPRCRRSRTSCRLSGRVLLRSGLRRTPASF
ncbi:MBL fold metallo-hydrolase [Nonomuraea sp. H19]|uniref:MBL fold metallo-hydrolase n=1 Tax=Nonomuraea sp. H19 TaxID=3452206 RepID=UPI003F8ABB2B